MNSEIFLQGFRDHWRSLAWWAFGIAFFVVVNLVFYPSIRDSSGINDYSKDLPEAMRALFVGGEMDLTSPAGFLNSQIFALMGPSLLTIFAVSTGASSVAGDEERGLLDLRLAQPLSRLSLVVQEYLWLMAAVGVLSAALLVSTVVGSQLFDLDVSAARVLAIVVSSGLFGLLFGTVALAVGCLFPGRARAVAVAASAAIAAWMLDGLSKVTSWLEPFQGLSPYDQAFGTSPLSNGPDWSGWLILILVNALFLLIAVIGLRARDVRS